MKKPVQLYLSMLPIITMLILPVSLKAQKWGETKMNLQAGAAIPSGSFRDFVSKTTGRAWNLNVLQGITDKWAAGGEVGFKNFYEKFPRQLYQTTSGSDISAVLSNTAEVIPVMAKGRYNFTPEKKVQPFFSLAAGVSFINIKQYVGEFSNIDHSQFGFTAAPELGVFIPFTKRNNSGANLAFSYHYLPFKYQGIGNLDYLSLQIGVSFSMRR